MPRKILIVVAMLLFAFPLMGADDSCSEEEPTVEKQGDGGSKSVGATAGVGDKLTLKGTTYRVTDVKTAKKIGNEYTGATANGTFIVVDLQLTNEEDEPATIIEDNIRIIGGNGSSYSTSDDAILVYPEQTLLLEEIQPGVTESGKLVYDLPPEAVKGAKLQVEDLFSGSTGDIKLGL